MSVVKKAKPIQTDPDATTARRLARELVAIADALEGGEHPEHEPARRDHVRRMAKARYEIGDARPNVADNLHRDWAIANLRMMGESMRKLVKLNPDAMTGGMLGATISMLSADLPEYRKRFEREADLIGRILQSYVTNVGGRPGKSRPKMVEGRPELHAQLCEAMGWTASADSMRGAKRRRKTKRVTR